MTLEEAMARYAAESVQFQRLGVTVDARCYLTDELKHNFMAYDAQPIMQTAPNSGIPVWLSTYIDPAIYDILFAPTEAAEIVGEERKGDITTTTATFQTVEHTVEVSTYGDFNENGRASVNTNWPNRQSYIFQVMAEYGDIEIERAGLGRLNLVSALDKAAADGLNRFSNLSYFYGIGGILCFGLFNDPNLGAPLTPATKANGGTAWFTVDGHPNATANEVYNDIVALYQNNVQQNLGNVNKKSPMVLALSPGSEVALTFTNSFNVNVEDLLKKNFPGLRIQTAVQYGALSADNPQGVAAGNFMQLIVETIKTQKTAFCAFNEKLRAFPIIRAASSYKQKKAAGTFGAVIRMPVGFTSMVGI
ncbi:hypothetical protein LJR220_003344 [Bradyrhizobium sp. LjRoot220]|uniref:hypothetical protein n=1 Tax=Bradyrhizobium sp. LjRoot220 TaxID=3342284 RepID=UPI003ECD12F5